MTDIAAILREHHSRQGMVGADHKCVKCNVWFDDAAAFAAHQAEKVWEALRAGGWVQGHEETMVIPCISPAGHEWGDLNRCIWCGRAASLVNVRRYVTDWEKA